MQNVMLETIVQVEWIKFPVNQAASQQMLARNCVSLVELEVLPMALVIHTVRHAQTRCTVKWEPPAVTNVQLTGMPRSLKVMKNA